MELISFRLDTSGGFSNDSLGSMKGVKYLDQPSGYWLLKENSIV
jgi:hypothetical protein